MLIKFKARFNIKNSLSKYSGPTDEQGGFELTLINPELLVPGDCMYSISTRKSLRELFAKGDDMTILRLPPIIIMVPPESNENVVVDGNHRVEAADYTNRCVLGVRLHTNNGIKKLLELAKNDPCLNEAIELIRYKKLHNNTGDRRLCSRSTNICFGL